MDNPSNETMPRWATEEIIILCKTVFESRDRPGQILRLHALTEWYIERLLSILLKKPDFVLNDPRFTYSHKLKILQSLNGLPERVADALRGLSKLRNECAHSMYPIISDEQIREAAQPIKKELNLTLQDHENNGLKQDVFHAYVWSIFSELSLSVAPVEMAYKEIFGNKA